MEAAKVRLEEVRAELGDEMPEVVFVAEGVFGGGECD